MKLYHASTVVIKHPVIMNRFKTLDFGTGFYTTSNEQQARDFARKTFVRRGSFGAPTVNIFECNWAAAKKALFNQYLFCNKKALAHLAYSSSYEVGLS